MKSISTLLLLITLMADLHAQTCTNESIKFKETFGTGNTAALASGRTNYNYNSGTLNDGDYKLSKSSQGRPEWYNSGDHTGDVNGRMMVINASYAAGEFYRDTVYGLSQAATYSVYFFVMNVNTPGTCSPNPILPRLQLIIESYNANGSFTQLASIVSSDIPQTASATWVKVGGFFNLPVNVTSVRYRVINNATGGCGNDLAIDDITFSQCAPMILPVSGLSLRATATDNGVALNWMTYEEKNLDKFIVEKSTDGKKWIFLTDVKSAGESNSRKDYEARDNNTVLGSTYYRIAAIDIDGKKNYSNVVMVRTNASSSKHTVYPNPFMNSISLELVSTENTNGLIRIFNINGKMMKSVSLRLNTGVNVTTISDLKDLSAGLYFLDVTNSNGNNLYKTTLVKQ